MSVSKKKRAKPRIFSPQEATFISQNYQTLTDAELAAKFLTNPRVVRSFRRKKKLLKVEQGCFKKNHTPWNQGMKGLQIADPKTWFQKGHKPHNTKKDECISIRKDSSGRRYQWIRISEGHWQMLARYNYTKYIGPIPKGKIIIFKDKDTMNADASNLEAISKAENVRRNYNREKAILFAKELHENYIIGVLSRGMPEIKESLRRSPHLVHLKRLQLLSCREIKKQQS